MSFVAKCTARKRIFGRIKVGEFQYTYRYDGEPQDNRGDTFNIITFDRELEFDITWTIVPVIIFNYPDRWCIWKELKLQQCESNIYGNFVIQGKLTGHDAIFNGSFDSASLPFKQRLSKIQCVGGPDSLETITIKFQIYSEDGRRFTAVANDANYMENEKPKDVTFVVGGEEIRACKNIVTAHSDIFAAMFEKKTRVEITDTQPSIFKMLLKFLLCGQIDSNNTDELLELMAAANKYSMKSLVNLCAYRLSDNLTSSNVEDIMATAHLLKEKILMKHCFIFCQMISKSGQNCNDLIDSPADI